MIPQLRFPEFWDKWQEKKLIDVADVVDGDRGLNYPKRADFSEDGYCLFLNAGNVTSRGFNFQSKQFISAQSDDALNKGKLSREDIVLTTRGTVGNFAYYSESVPYDQVRINSGMVLLRTRSSITAKYLYTSSPYLNRQIRSITFGSAQPQLTVGAILKLKLLIPSKPEQEKIADFLAALAERIHLSEENLKQLQHYKRDIMQKIFSQQIRFKDESNNSYPTWKEKKLGDIVEIKSGSAKSGFIEAGGKNVIVDMGAISSNGTLIDIKRTNFSGDFIEVTELVMAKDDIGGGNIIGKVIKITENERYVLGDHVYKLTPNGVDRNFLYYSINRPEINREFRRNANGTAQLGISNNTVYQQVIVLPATEEQQKIAAFLTTIDDKINAQQAVIKATVQLKKALLQRMFA